MDKPKEEYLICFVSGHYKSFKGWWLGDSIWIHFKTDGGHLLHFNKEEVEYIQHRPVQEEG